MRPQDEDNKHFDEWVRQKMSLVQPEFDEEAWMGMEQRLKTVPASYWSNSDGYWKLGVFFALFIIISGLIGLWFILEQDLLHKEAAIPPQEQPVSPPEEGSPARSIDLSHPSGEDLNHSRKLLDSLYGQLQNPTQDNAQGSMTGPAKLSQNNALNENQELGKGPQPLSNISPPDENREQAQAINAEIPSSKPHTGAKRVEMQANFLLNEGQNIAPLPSNKEEKNNAETLEEGTGGEANPKPLALSLEAGDSRLLALNKVKPFGTQLAKPSPLGFQTDTQPYVPLNKLNIGKKRRFHTGLWIANEWDQIDGGQSNSSSWLVGLSMEYEISRRWSLSLGGAYTQKSYRLTESSDKSIQVDFPLLAATLELDPNQTSLNASFFDSQLSQVQSELIEIFIGANYRISSRPRNHFFIQTGISNYLFLKQEFIQDYRAVNAQGTATRLLATLNLSEEKNQPYWGGMFNLGIGWEHSLTSRTKVQFIPYFKLGLRDVGKENTRIDSYGIRSLILWGW